jgi:ABC-type uncharacterized transport system permease subunit
MKSLRAQLTDLLVVAASIGAALLLAALLLALTGHPRLIWEWAVGAAGSRADLLIVLKRACPLILTGLAAGVAFRSGVFNIGAEGQSILGSIAAVALATRLLPSLPQALAIPAILLAAALGGALWALIPAMLDRWRSVPIVLSTILLNFIALQLLALLLDGPLRTSLNTGIIQSDPLPRAFLLPTLLQYGAGNVHAGILLALLLAALCWIVQSRTAYGFEIRVTGLNPTAARYAGMPVAARQFAVMLWSGAFAGLAGCIQLMGVEGGHQLGKEPSSYGYAGIAVALLGRLHPAGIVAAALFFALLDNGADALESFSIPHEISDILKGFIVLLLLAATAYAARRSRSAEDSGGAEA